MTRKIPNLLAGLVLALCLAPITGAQERQEPLYPRGYGYEEVDPRLNPLPGHRADIARVYPEGRPIAPVDGAVGPTTTSTRWSDTFEDDSGFTWMDSAAVIDGDVVLSQIAALGYAAQGGSVLAMTVSSNGKVYLGTSGAYLNVYDPSTGTMTSLGAPVPDECFG